MNFNNARAKQNIVILGAGFAGVRAALDLARHLPSEVKITLIDRNSFHSYTPAFYEVAAVFLPEKKELSRKQFESLASTVAVPLKTIFKKYKQVKPVIGEVEEILPEKNQVKIKSGGEYHYDWLIIALGSELDFFGLSEIKEYVYNLKNLEGALNLRNGIDELFYRRAKEDSEANASLSLKREKIKIAVAGGGFLGSEIAAELAGYVEKLNRQHSRPEENCEITVVEGGMNVLGNASEWARKKAARRLKKLGVKILTNSLISKVTKEKMVLKDGRDISYDILIWTTGVRACAIAGWLAGQKLKGKGCLAVDQYLRVIPYENIFAAGDIAYASDYEINAFLPMTAQVAILHGKYIAYTIKRIIRKRRPFPYWPHQNRFSIALGGCYALFDGRRLKFSGFFAWLLKHLTTLKYFASILPFHRAFFIWRRGLKTFRKTTIDKQ
ncbi:MAG: NAD(P)/FAD-dependent oxidoreductase [Patescibacteria group bacterium]